MAMDIGNSFQYPSRDKDWVVKVLIGGVLNIIPIANLIASGYVLTLMARSMDRLQEEMPKWDDWGGYLMKGLMVAVISLIYCVIPLGVMMIGLLPMIAGAVGAQRRGGRGGSGGRSGDFDGGRRSPAFHPGAAHHADGDNGLCPYREFQRRLCIWRDYRKDQGQPG